MYLTPDNSSGQNPSDLSVHLSFLCSCIFAHLFRTLVLIIELISKNVWEKRRQLKLLSNSDEQFNKRFESANIEEAKIP